MSLLNNGFSEVLERVGVNSEVVVSFREYDVGS
jgi:hypothetical protein